MNEKIKGKIKGKIGGKIGLGKLLERFEGWPGSYYQHRLRYHQHRGSIDKQPNPFRPKTS